MKSVLRKIRGKKKDDAERSAIQINNANAQGYPQASPAPQLPSENQDLGSSTTRGQNENAPLLTATGISNKLQLICFRPLSQLAGLMAQPASTSTEDPTRLIQIEQAMLCTVCCHFDPKQAPPDGDIFRDSWATMEYKMPADASVGKIVIEQPEMLLEAARGGCLYCNMVKVALGAAHPGWDKEKTFIEIYLATGLPVIVRLEFGVTSMLQMGRDHLLSLGFDVPEAEGIQYLITVRDSSKEGVELEIYRPLIPENQLTIGDIALAPLVREVGFGEEIPTNSDDQACFDFIKRNIVTCGTQHKCVKNKALPLLPDRVLWIEANTPSRIRLIEPKSIRAPFIALSYCWGPVDSNTFLTTAATLDARKSSIELADLPPLFQDVVAATRALEIEYIWIDRLCILQDVDADFLSQAPKMAEIYGNAIVTIAATAAATENDRILGPRDDKWLPFDLAMNIGPVGSVKLRFRRLPYTLGTEHLGGVYGRWSTRAWIWQERLLAARTAFFTPGSLKFECHRHSFWEGFDRSRTGNSWSAKLDDISHSTWTDLVEEYTSRDITRPSDRLPAMNAVMKRIEQRTGWSPFWGLWADALNQSLSWAPQGGGVGGTHTCCMNPGHYAPTWSWASVDGPISYSFVRPWSMVDETDPMRWDLECRSLNGVSGLIRFSGQVIPLELIVTIEENRPNGDEAIETHEVDSVTPNGFVYRYKVKSSGEAEGFPIYPDVVLKPWRETLGGQLVSTVVRVPFGETPPKQSWNAQCIGLLMGRRKMRAVVLFLGRSMRESGAWERIGIASGMSPEIFSTSQRRIVDMI